MAFNSLSATFSFFTFIFGVILTYLTIDQQSKISINCTSTKVQTGLNIILMLSIMMVIIPLVQLYCHYGCGQPQTDIKYEWIIISILTLLTVAGGTVWNGLDNEENCGLSSAKLYIKTLVISSSVLFSITVAFMIWSKYNNDNLD